MERNSWPEAVKTNWRLQCQGPKKDRLKARLCPLQWRTFVSIAENTAD